MDIGWEPSVLSEDDLRRDILKYAQGVVQGYDWDENHASSSIGTALRSTISPEEKRARDKRNVDFVEPSVMRAIRKRRIKPSYDEWRCELKRAAADNMSTVLDLLISDPECVPEGAASHLPFRSTYGDDEDDDGYEEMLRGGDWHTDEAFVAAVIYDSPECVDVIFRETDRRIASNFVNCRYVEYIALSLACELGRLEIADMLLERYPKSGNATMFDRRMLPNCDLVDSVNYLEIACTTGNAALMRILVIKHGIWFENGGGLNTAIRAVEKEFEDVARVILIDCPSCWIGFDHPTTTDCVKFVGAYRRGKCGSDLAKRVADLTEEYAVSWEYSFELMADYATQEDERFMETLDEIGATRLSKKLRAAAKAP